MAASCRQQSTRPGEELCTRAAWGRVVQLVSSAMSFVCCQQGEGEGTGNCTKGPIDQRPSHTAQRATHTLHHPRHQKLHCTAHGTKVHHKVLWCGTAEKTWDVGRMWRGSGRIPRDPPHIRRPTHFQPVPAHPTPTSSLVLPASRPHRHWSSKHHEKSAPHPPRILCTSSTILAAPSLVLHTLRRAGHTQVSRCARSAACVHSSTSAA